MNRRGIRLLCACLVGALLAAGATSCRSGTPHSRVVVNGQTFEVEIADTEASRQAGLSNRSSLAADRGMLFLFARPGALQFYIKDCYFDIDVAFIDESRRIINLETMAMEADPANPKRYYHSDRPAKYVLETAGGTWKRIGAQPGMAVTFVDVPETRAPEAGAGATMTYDNGQSTRITRIRPFLPLRIATGASPWWAVEKGSEPQRGD